jgi:Fe-S-cluster containining protein
MPPSSRIVSSRIDPARIRFVCQPGCTNCCDQRGYVYLTEADLLRAAAFVNLTPEDFERRYVYRTRHLLRLRKPPRSQCHFLEHGGCGIHPAKPTQCRTFPFWPDLLASVEAWSETARYCPGMGQGDFVPLEEVERSLKEMGEADT